MRRAAGLYAAALLAIASAADAQAWNVETIAPGGSASSYSFTGATDSEALRLDTSCRAIVYGFDPNVASGAASGTADLLSCPSLTATGAACQKIADLDADIAGATANPAYRFLRCDVQTSPAGATSVCTVACAAQSAATGSGGGGGGGGVTDAGALTYAPASVGDWAICDPDPVMTGEYLDCIGEQMTSLGGQITALDGELTALEGELTSLESQLAGLVVVTEDVGFPASSCTTDDGQPCMEYQTQNAEVVALWVGSDGGDFGMSRYCQRIHAGGVFSCKVSSGVGFTTVEKVVIAPPRLTTSDHPDGDVLMQAAWDYAAGNTANNTDVTGPGGSTNRQCLPIEVTPGIYALDQTVFFEHNAAGEVRSPCDVDGNGSQWVSTWPAPDGSSTVAGLATCDGGTAPEKGDTCEVTDSLTIDDVTVGGAPAASTISLIDSDTATCPQKYGTNTVLIDTAADNTFQDSFTTVNGGNMLQVPTLVRVTGTSTYQIGRDGANEGVYPVTWAKDPDEFCVKTLTTPPVASEATGTVDRVNALAWYDGVAWHEGQPMFALGGPVALRTLTNVTLHDFVFSYGSDITNSRSIRTKAIFLNGHKVGQGGLNGVSLVNITLIPGGGLRGFVGVDVGGRIAGESRNVKIDRLNVDPMGASHSILVRTRNAADFIYTNLYAIHGGALWFGTDDGGTTPHTGFVHGTMQGVKDGPGVVVWSGNNYDFSNLEVASSVNGPLQAPPGPDAGLIAILGGANTAVQINKMFSRIDAAPETDLDCYVHLGDISATQHGGYFKKGTGSSAGTAGGGQGIGATFCTRTAGAIGRFVIQNADEEDSDATELVPLFDLTTNPAAAIDFLCPNCESTETVYYRYGDGSPAPFAVNICLAVGPNIDGGGCASATSAANLVYYPWGSGRAFIHDCTLAVTSGIALGDGDNQTLQFVENVNDGSTVPAAISGAAFTFNGTHDPGTTVFPINRYTTLTQGLMGLRFSAVTVPDTIESGFLQAACRRSILVQ